MTDTSSTGDDSPRRHVLAWLLFPLALFPLMALLTYDARTYTDCPPAPSSNWIGALGDAFAHYGYMLFGLAVWIVPALCVVGGFCMVRGRRMRPGRRELWFIVFLSAVSCLVQVLGGHGGPVQAVQHRINIADAGGAVGYLVMTRALSPLLSDFGSSILVAIIALIALVGAVGAHNLAAFASAMFRWAMGGARREPSLSGGGPGESAANEGFDPYEAARQAKEEARRQREEEKARIREEKLRLKEEKRAAKEAAKLAKREAAEAARAAKAEVAPPPPPPPSREGQAGGGDGEEGGEDDKGPYLLPPLSLLNPLKKSAADHGDVGEMTRKLIDTLKIFGIDAELAYTVQGPVVTKYAVRLAPGTRYSAVTAISDNLMGSLRAKSLRIEAPIPGEDCVGIEVPNRTSAGISFREIIESDAWRNFKGELPLLFGKNAAGKELVADLASMPHMLVAGATGQGKSVCLNSLINGLLMTKTPEQLKLIMVDPKSVEFTAYASLPHLIVPVITDNKKVVFSLRWAVQEMEKRLKLFARARVRNIYDFNHRPNLTQTELFGGDTAVVSDMPRTVPYIVIIIDEVADLMASNGKEVTPDIARLTAKARAAGIHLILATQRPDAKIITGTIKANIPGRVAFKTSQAIDSRTILDEAGAENLIGKGDMLFKGKDGVLVRAQGAWISDEEIARVTEFIEQHSNPDFDQRFTKKLATIKEDEVDIYADDSGDDGGSAKAAQQAEREQVKADENASDFKKAVECIINTNRASTSHFQRKLGWGYNHSAKIMDMLEDAGVIGPQVGAGPRQIIMEQEQLLAIFNGSGGASEGGGAAEAGGVDQPVDSEDSFSQEQEADS
ncbi:MAG: DNA translocase FtsK [Kiritimatiellae bacterium]|nr:DNA translocase FtsK [Kiritimatiellia bacterium]